MKNRPLVAAVTDVLAAGVVAPPSATGQEPRPGRCRLRRIPLLVGTAVISWTLVLPGDVRAQSGGLYVSQELGINLAPRLGIEGVANDFGSICDEYVNPFTDLMPAFCGDPDSPPTAWTNAFEGAGGILAAGAVGYGFGDAGRLRIELEYLFRETVYNETSAIQGRGGVTVAKLDGEVVSADDRIGSVTSHNVFGNLYFDFVNRSRLTPYVGVGAGFGFTNVDHGTLWIRNSDPDLISSVVQYFPSDRLDDLRTVQRNLASTATSNQTELSDRLFGYQVAFGLDYALTDSLSFGVKGRRVAFGTFSDNSPVDRLRGHASNKRLDGSEPATYRLMTGDIALFAVGVNLRYRF